MPRTVAVVGGGLVGVSVAEEIRSLDPDVRIVVLGAETQLPYDRPPLSKQFLTGAVTEASRAVTLHPCEWYTERRIELHTGRPARGLCTRPLEILLDGGDRLRPDAVVIATGARPRLLPAQPLLDGVLTLRGLSEAQQLRQHLSSGAGKLVIVGAGFIGLEVATSAASMGWQVDVLEHARTPLTRVLPPEIVRDLLMPHAPEGVRVRCATSVEEIIGRDRVTGVRLGDGSILDADLVLMAIGASPDTDWLRDSGVLVEDGVVCDGFGATSAAGVWAAGDVARWPNTATGLHLRSEQWQAAKDQARVVARSIVEQGMPAAPVGAAPWETTPYFWSDFFGLKVQLVGHCAPSMRTRVARVGRKSLAVMGHDTVQAVLGVNSPRGVALCRQLLGSTDLDAAHRWAQDQLAPRIPATAPR